MDRCTNCRKTTDYACDWGWCRECVALRDELKAGAPVFRARKARNPRNGAYHSLRVIFNALRPDGAEFARLRRCYGKWDIWAEDKAEDRAYKAALHRHRSDVLHDVASDDLAGALHYVRRAYEEFHKETEAA